MSLELIEQMVRAANPVPDVTMLGGGSDRAAVDPDDIRTEIDELFVDGPPDGGSSDDQLGDRHPRRRWMLVAAATVAVLGLGLLAVTATRDTDRVQTDTVPPTTPAPTTPAPTTSISPTTTVSAPERVTVQPGEQITVTNDLVEFGDGLVGLIGNMARADGRTYVIAGRYETEEDLLFAPDEAVLAAFDDRGSELWRIELDGTPIRVVVVDDDLWIRSYAEEGNLTRVDSSTGRVLGRLTIDHMVDIAGGFGSLWVQTDAGIYGEGSRRQVVRIDPDLSTTSIEIPPVRGADECDPCAQGVVAGSDAMWVPLEDLGVGRIDPVTNELAVISREDIGHDVLMVAVDGEVAYVASDSQASSIVDERVVANSSVGRILYLGRVEGIVGAQLPDGQFAVLRPDAPMVVEHRQLATDGPESEVGIGTEIDGEAWTETGRNYHLRRIELEPVAGADD